MSAGQTNAGRTAGKREKKETATVQRSKAGKRAAESKMPAGNMNKSTAATKKEKATEEKKDGEGKTGARCGKNRLFFLVEWVCGKNILYLL